MVKQISCVTSRCGNRCKALLTQNTCLVNIILLVAEIIPDNWSCFSFWHQVFVFAIFSCSLLIFQCCYQRLTPCRGWSASTHWLRTNVIGRSLCMQSVCQVPLKLDEFICVLHCRLCDVTIAHTYITPVMLKRDIVQPYHRLLLSPSVLVTTGSMRWYLQPYQVRQVVQPL